MKKPKKPMTAFARLGKARRDIIIGTIYNQYDGNAEAIAEELAKRMPADELLDMLEAVRELNRE